MLILEENFRRHLEAFASELFISLLLMLKTVLLLYILCGNHDTFYFRIILMIEKFERTQ